MLSKPQPTLLYLNQPTVLQCQLQDVPGKFVGFVEGHSGHSWLACSARGSEDSLPPRSNLTCVLYIYIYIYINTHTHTHTNIFLLWGNLRYEYCIIFLSIIAALSSSHLAFLSLYQFPTPLLVGISYTHK